MNEREINKMTKPPVIPNKFDTYLRPFEFPIPVIVRRRIKIFRYAVAVPSASRAKYLSYFVNILQPPRRSVKSMKKIHLSRIELRRRTRFLRSTSRRILRALHAKEVCDPLRQTRTHVSVILQAQPGPSDRMRRNWAVKSARWIGLHDPTAIETPAPDTNILFARNCQYSLYPAYSELFSERNAINTLKIIDTHSR